MIWTILFWTSIYLGIGAIWGGWAFINIPDSKPITDGDMWGGIRLIRRSMVLWPVGVVLSVVVVVAMALWLMCQGTLWSLSKIQGEKPK